MDRFSLSIMFLTVGLVMLVSVSGCAKTQGEGAAGSPSRRASVSFSVSIRDSDGVWPAAAVENINIYVYRDGMLEDSAYSGEADKIGISVETGREYSFYALANVGQRYPPVEERLLKSSRYDIAGLEVLQSGMIPMSASAEASVSGEHCSIPIELSPVAAKLGLKLEAPARWKYRVQSVRVVNLAADYCPFVDNYQARLMLEDDYSAKESEVSALNDGKLIYLPVLENCQGTFFTGNTDSRSKTPDGLPQDKQDKSTYVEITLARNAASSIICRFCLGRDALEDCNVVRNTYMRVTLRVTGRGRRDYVWEVADSLHAPQARFIAAGESGTVVYTDSHGELVNIRLGTGAWRDVVCADGAYVMASDGGSLAFSADGESWHVTETGDIHWQAVASGGGRYVAVGYRYDSTGSGPGRMAGYTAVSVDGMSWSLVRQDSHYLKDIAYGGGRFLATGYVTVTGILTAGRFFLLDDEGVWQILSGLYKRAYPCLIYGKGKFAAIDDGYVVYSEDGTEWTSMEDTGCRNISYLAYGGGTYVGTGADGRTVYSLGGFGWTSSDAAGNGLSCVTYGGIFISAGKGGLVMFSSDGKSWNTLETGVPYYLYCASVKI